MSDLTWTKEKPTETGWYWISTLAGPKIVCVQRFARDNTLLVYVGTDGLGRTVRGFDGDWAGPIPLPEEPFDETVTVADIGTMVEVSDHPTDSLWMRRNLVAIINHKWKYVCEDQRGAGVCWLNARRIREKL